MVLHNLPSFIRLLHFLEKSLVSRFWVFLKSLKQPSIMCHQHLHHQYFLIVAQVIFVELLFDQHLILFLYLNQLLLVYNDFWCINNLINILYYSLHLIQLLTFLFLYIFLYQNQWVGDRSFSIDNNVVIIDNTFW